MCAAKEIAIVYVIYLICNLEIISLISLSDIVSINELTVMLKFICQCNVKHIMTLLIKTITNIIKWLCIFLIQIGLEGSLLPLTELHVHQ
jgi:hypothetical protein